MHKLALLFCNNNLVIQQVAVNLGSKWSSIKQNNTFVSLSFCTFRSTTPLSINLKLYVLLEVKLRDQTSTFTVQTLLHITVPPHFDAER